MTASFFPKSIGPTTTVCVLPGFLNVVPHHPDPEPTWKRRGLLRLHEPGFEQPRCPRCRSTDITYERYDRKTAMASLFVLGLPLPLGSASWTCEKCGLRWKEEDDSSERSDSPA